MAEFQAATGADDTAMARLAAFAELLAATNAHTNLVSAASLADLWRRHMFDSAQLMPLIPVGARRYIDLGSGAGFPGLVLAALTAARVGFETTLVESIAKKCAFLEAAIAAMRLQDRVTVRRGRAEDLKPVKADLITARAVADLPTLLSYAQAFSHPGTVLLFPKGRMASDELTAARRIWTLGAETIPSRSDSSGTIILIRSFAPKGKSKAKR